MTVVLGMTFVAVLTLGLVISYFVGEKMDRRL